MDLHALLSLDLGPAPLEFVLHIPPDLPRLPIELVHLDFGGLLELVKSEFTLNDCCLKHKELELSEG